ncbi:uncharacterized protein LOC8263052 [Ricinus communis]|uniref:Uncharacterized protein n=1 Tax=Ricinus communis TaxID=3988 RepID=B9RJI2_RICCO|nr:uncharacterized protein LOC8263052 [Ricinus communis]EEF48484.1 conserved hypothetical protein [Ricinus communis]|eukprot:XP_002513901.1 uncharacterized protein LOC8263052 [Ricinus communis]
MAPWLFKTVNSLSSKNYQQLHKSPIHNSISLIFFSTSRPSEIKPKVTIFDYLINHQQFSPESASNVLSSTTKYVKKPQNADLVLSFLTESGFSKIHIENVVQKVPQVLSSKFETSIKPKIKIFQDLGFESIDIADIVSADPWVLTRSADNRLGPSLLVLKNVLGTNAGVVTLLKLSGWFLKHDLERVMMPNIDYLKSCGISSSQIVKYVYNFPRFFLMKPESIKGFVKRVDEMGFDRKSKMFLPAIRTMSSMTVENWELKLKLLRDLGLSEENILSVFKRVPQAFAISERKIKDVTKLLLNVGNLDISYIVRHPDLLICSVNQRLKPRLAVLQVLENKKLLQKKPSFTSFFKISGSQFLHKYVIPYSDELGDLSLGRYSQ